MLFTSAEFNKVLMITACSQISHIVGKSGNELNEEHYHPVCRGDVGLMARMMAFGSKGWG